MSLSLAGAYEASVTAFVRASGRNNAAEHIYTHDIIIINAIFVMTPPPHKPRPHCLNRRRGLGRGIYMYCKNCVRNWNLLDKRDRRPSSRALHWTQTILVHSKIQQMALYIYIYILNSTKSWAPLVPLHYTLFILVISVVVRSFNRVFY